MATLLDFLPSPESTTSSLYDHSKDTWFKKRYTDSEQARQLAASAQSILVPPYGMRAGFMPCKLEDYGDGGAFPEIHIDQYPLSMGSKSERRGSKILPLTVDLHGNVAFDAIVKQNENASKIVYSQYMDLIPKIVSSEFNQSGEMDKEILETMVATKAALERIVDVRLSAAQPNYVPQQSSEAQFIKYKPSQQSAAFNSGAKERIVKMAELPVDPLDPPKFKHKRVPKASGSPPVPVMQSPPRPVTVKDQQDWKIPPCISNWKNPKGYTIPLDKRLAADGRDLQDVQVNDNFAKLSEALYVSEQKAREAVAMRSKVQKELALKVKERKEQELRALAQRARSERIGGLASTILGNGDQVPAIEENFSGNDLPGETSEEHAGRMRREHLREQRRRERERKRRLEIKDATIGKKSKITRDRDRDISERIVLGMANVGGGHSGEAMFDSRLLNQEQGLGSGFTSDELYNAYDKGLSTAQATLSTLYKPKKDFDGGADEQLNKILRTDRFKPDKGFAGASDRACPRDVPVEFEKQPELEADPFGLGKFFDEMKDGKKAMGKNGFAGTMSASGGSSNRDADGGSGRTRVDFQRGRL